MASKERKRPSPQQPNHADPPSVLQLVARQRDPKIVQHLQAMLQDALEGKVVGVIASVHYGGREFSYLAVGSMCDCPTLGITSALKLKTKLLQHNI